MVVPQKKPDRLRSLRHSIKRLARRIVTGAPSSLTDSKRYRTLCELAVHDAAAFANFRGQAIYLQVLEHVDKAAGLEAISSALQEHPEYRSLLTEFRRNDNIGGPKLEHYEGLGDWSPTTLRYIKVLGDIETYFGDLSHMNVVEIGAGYGGQCRLVLGRFSVASYTIFGLPEAGQLASRFVEALGGGPLALNPPLSEFSSKRIDLLISNYALSEIRRELQDKYFEAVVSRAARGYMLWNASANLRLSMKILPSSDLPYSAEEAAAKIPDAQVIRTKPPLLESDRRVANALILWGQQF